jgi:hypothetical protein
MSGTGCAHSRIPKKMWCRSHSARPNRRHQQVTTAAEAAEPRCRVPSFEHCDTARLTLGLPDDRRVLRGVRL